MCNKTTRTLFNLAFAEKAGEKLADRGFTAEQVAAWCADKNIEISGDYYRAVRSGYTNRMQELQTGLAVTREFPLSKILSKHKERGAQ